MDIFVNILANLIIQKYLQNCHCLLIFTDLENSFLYSGNLPVINVEIQNNNIRPEIFFHYFGCQGIVVKTKKPVSFYKTFEKEIKLRKERFNERRFLFLPGNDMEENITDIFYSDEIMYVADLDIIEENTNGSSFLIWTHSYVGHDIKHKILLDVWFSNNQTFLYNRDLYPDKLKDQMSRNLRMATFTYEPYSIIGKQR